MDIGPLPEYLQDVRSLSPNEADCKFIKSLYIEVRDQTLDYYLAKKTRQFGGNSYKIISTSHELVMGENILMVNFEIYKCEEEELGTEEDFNL